MKYMDMACWLAYALVIIGALNWGLYAIDKKLDLVAYILGDYSMAARIVYGLVGASGLCLLASHAMKQ